MFMPMGPHRGQPIHPRTAPQAHQKGFRQIITRMGEGHRRQPLRPICQQSASRPTCRILQIAALIPALPSQCHMWQV